VPALLVHPSPLDLSLNDSTSAIGLGLLEDDEERIHCKLDLHRNTSHQRAFDYYFEFSPFFSIPLF